MLLSDNNIYLTQTDTIVGFLSSDYKKLNKIKSREIDKKVLIEANSFKILKKIVRVPQKFKKYIKRGARTTFIYPNKKGIRVVKDKKHLNFLDKFSYLYSTSANKTKQKFSIDFAINNSDIVVYSKEFSNKGASKIFKISKKKIKKIR